MEFRGHLSRPGCVDMKSYISVSKFRQLHSRHTAYVDKKSYISVSKFSQLHNWQPAGGLCTRPTRTEVPILSMCGLTLKFGIR